MKTLGFPHLQIIDIKKEWYTSNVVNRNLTGSSIIIIGHSDDTSTVDG
jgi:hypothetical protein